MRKVNADLETLQAFQEDQCGQPFCQRYGAFGTGIGKRIAQRASQGVAPSDEWCLRVFVTDKSDGAPRQLPKAFSFRGKRVPVDVCKAGRPLRLDAALLPSSLPFASGFDSAGLRSSGRIGSLGGWAWHTASDSLVLMSCWHVVGHQPAEVEDRSGRSALPLGRVRAGVEVRAGGETNTVDCAIVDPMPEAMQQLRFLERLLPTLVTADLALRGGPGAEVIRYRRWAIESGGQIGGVVVDRNVRMEIDYPHGRCWFEQLFAVQAEGGGVWGRPGDSGSLILLREAADGSRPVLGVYMAQIDEGMNGERPWGIACRIENVMDRLGIEPVEAQPLLAFIDSLYEHPEPLDFLSLRRPTEMPITQRGRAQALTDYMRSEGGTSLVGPLERNRQVATGLLVERESLRRAAADAIGPLLRAHPTPAATLQHVLSTAERGRLLNLIRLLRHASQLGMKEALAPFAAAVCDRRARTLGEVLRRIDQAAPDLMSIG